MGLYGSAFHVHINAHAYTEMCANYIWYLRLELQEATSLTFHYDKSQNIHRRIENILWFRFNYLHFTILTSSIFYEAF